MSRINDLLRELDASNPALAKDLRREVEALTDRRAFGLNFERHQPEVVELPGRTVRRGDKVHVLPERGTNPTKDNQRLWRVADIDRSVELPVAHLESLARVVEVPGAPAPSLETLEKAVDDLVVVAEFRDPIYPGLVSTGKVERGGDKPFHTVINAENYHALQTLLFTHRGQVDCIYIDPPYNTGNEGWIYNDQYVAGDDLYKHSKWLAFMERRLLLAKELLKPTGVIIVAIDDAEQARLKLLMDQVFNADNFIATVVWQGGHRNDAKYVATGHDYMLIYARDEPALVAAGSRWREKKLGLEEATAAAAQIWEQAGGDHKTATAAWRNWMRSFKVRSGITDGVGRYTSLDESTGVPVYTGQNLSSPNPRPNLQYDLLHPVTGRPVKRHANGWRYSQEQMALLVQQGRVRFGADHNSGAQGVSFLSEFETQIVKSIFDADRRNSTKRLANVLGDKRFPFPKDHEVIMRWLRLVSDPDAVILDFFGGSGTTCEAVMRLNEEDGGTRRCILVTNNELAAADAQKLRKAGHRAGDPEWEAKGVYEYVATPRLQTIVSGIRTDGSTYSEGLEQNVEFFTLTYEAPLRVSSHREFPKIAPLLWMRAGSQGRRIDSLDAGWDVADTYGVVADLDQSEAFLKAVALAGDALRMAFIVTDEDRLFTTLCRELPDHVEPVRLYEAYLRNFEIESGRTSL